MIRGSSGFIPPPSSCPQADRFGLDRSWMRTRSSGQQSSRDSDKEAGKSGTFQDKNVTVFLHGCSKNLGNSGNNPPHFLSSQVQPGFTEFGWNEFQAEQRGVRPTESEVVLKLRVEVI